MPRLALLPCALLILSACQVTPKKLDETALPLYELDVKPFYYSERSDVTPIVRVEPKLPKYQRTKNGFVDVRFVVNEKGGVIAPIHFIYESKENVYRKEAERAVLKWKFKPEFKNGQPIKFINTTRVPFIHDKKTAPQRNYIRAEKRCNKVNNRKTKIKEILRIAPNNPFSEQRNNARVSLYFDVTAGGKPVKLSLASASMYNFTDESMNKYIQETKNALSQWRYTKQPVKCLRASFYYN